MNDRPGNLPLSGITVLDLTRVLAGPYATMMLADLGARVIKVEDPRGGDDSRHIGPFVDGESAYFASINRNKQSIAIDLKSPQGVTELDRLLATADVLVENFRPGVMDRLGYGWEEVHARHPRIVYASISGFGQTGPLRTRPAYDMVVQAMGGIMSVTGEAGGRPARVGVSIGDIGSGLFATIGIQAALMRRMVTGVGDRLDISMLDCQLALLENPIARYSATGEVPQATGTRHASITPFDVFRTADGLTVLAVGNDSLFRTLCIAIERGAWADDTRFNTNASRHAHHEALKDLLESRLADGSNAHWSAIFEKCGVPHGSMNDVADLFQSEQVKAREMLVPMRIGKEQEIHVAGNPLKFASFRMPQRLDKAPGLDEHRAALLPGPADPVIGTSTAK